MKDLVKIRVIKCVTIWHFRYMCHLLWYLIQFCVLILCFKYCPLLWHFKNEWILLQYLFLWFKVKTFGISRPHFTKISRPNFLLLLLNLQLFYTKISSYFIQKSPAILYKNLQLFYTEISSYFVQKSPATLYKNLQLLCTKISSYFVQKSPAILCKKSPAILCKNLQLFIQKFSAILYKNLQLFTKKSPAILHKKHIELHGISQKEIKKTSRRREICLIHTAN